MVPEQSIHQSRSVSSSPEPQLTRDGAAPQVGILCEQYSGVTKKSFGDAPTLVEEVSDFLVAFYNQMRVKAEGGDITLVRRTLQRCALQAMESCYRTRWRIRVGEDGKLRSDDMEDSSGERSSRRRSATPAASL